VINLPAVIRIAIARLLEFFRQPPAVLWVFGFPIGVLAVLGTTFTDRPPETLHIDLLHADRSAFGLRLQKKIEQDPRLLLNRPAQNSLQRLQRVGSSLIVDVEPEPREGALLNTAPSENNAPTRSIPQFTLTFDPDRPDSVHARAIVAMHIAQLASDAPTVRSVESNSIENRYVDFLIPGLLAVNTMGASLVWFGYGLCEWRLLGLLRSLLTTPLSKLELLLGLLLARLCLLIPETLGLLLVAKVMFGFSLATNWLLLTVIQVVGATAFCGIGACIGARGRALESASGWLSLLMLAQWVLCGVFFSRDVFPASWQPWISWLPLSAYVDAARQVMLDGSDLSSLMTPLTLLIAWIFISGFLGFKLFRMS
jgi:ABC-type multidrug transport system permease subunit